MPVKVKNKVVRSRLTSVFPFDVFQQGTLYTNKEIPSLKPAKRSPVETKVKAAQIPFKSETGMSLTEYKSQQKNFRNSLDKIV